MPDSATPKADERRRFPRFPVRHAASLEVPDRGAVHVVIEDYCPGGLFASLMDQGAVADHPDARAIEEGQVLQFSIVVDGSDVSLTNDVKVVRVGALGFGLAFGHAQAALASALGLVAKQQGFEHTDAGSTKIQRQVEGPVAADLETRCLEFAANALPALIETAKDELLTAASDAASDVGQAPYFEAMSQLRRDGGSISSAFQDALAAHLRTFDALPESTGDPSQSSANGELSLVNEEEFEAWLSMSEIVASIENRNHEALHALEARLTEMVGRRIDSRNNPLGAAAMCQHFAMALEGRDIGHRPAQVVWRSFGKKMNEVIKPFYDEANALLIDAGILPNLVFTPVRPRRGSAAGNGVNSPQPSSSQPTPPQPTESAPPDAYPDPVPQPGGYAQARPFGDDYLGTPPATPTNSAKIIDLQRLLKSRAAAEPAPSGQQNLNLADLQQALIKLQQNREPRQSGQSLDQRLRQALISEFGDSAPPVAPQHSNAVDLAEQLLSSISKDSVVEPRAKEWIGKLEIQLLKMLLKQQDLVTDQEHPARKVLDHLGQTIVGGAREMSGREQQLIEKIDGIVNRLSDLDDPNRDAFATAARELEQLLKRQHRLRAAQLKRVLEAADGQQKLAQARSAVTQELQQEFGQRQVPKPVNELLGMGWRNLLDVAAVRSGTRGPEWDRLYQVIKDLDARLSPDHTESPDDSSTSEALVSKISDRLDHVRADTSERDNLVDALRSMLPGLSDAPRQTPDTEPLDAHLSDRASDNSVASTAEHPQSDIPSQPKANDEDVADDTPPASQADKPGSERSPESEAAVQDPDKEHYLGLAKLLDKGSWLLYPGADGKTQPIKLAWISDDRQRYVFVNRNGQKALETGPEELAEKFRAKQAELIDQPDQPLMDRSWHGMVQNMHDQIAHQATHDQLTESLNRKEFERRIRLKLGESKLMHTQHIALQIEIDQFKVVNSTAGHEAGDQLLQDLARVMRKNMPEGGEMARLGGDTFAMLLPRFELAPGHEAAEKLRRSINEHRTRWKRRKLKATASIGLVLMGRDSESVSQVLNQMEIAAGAAKEAGRDRIKSYQIDDQELSQRDQAMRWVTELENALDQDRIVLFGQRIVPLERSDTDKDHFEVLCRMRGEDGQLVGPEKFIPAAEAYGRIHYLDEWVFRSAFNALNASPVKDRIARLSINLSGKTFGRPRFLTFIQNLFEETGIEPSKICFEITETAAISNLARCTDFLRELRYLGCRFSLDDFGTGLSSFSYLKHLPVDYLKIDGSFIRDIASSTADYGLVKTINEIGHFLGKETVAEFVETDEVLEHLKDIGLDFAQGFGIERPRPLNEILQI
ncbi:MAG: DUF1631 family protein [Lysobacterales bacterium]